jgi:hypothetical protein
MVIVSDFSVTYYRMLFGCKKSIIEDHRYFAHLLMNALLLNFSDFELDYDNPLILAVDCNKANNWRTKYYEENSKDFEEYNKPIRLKYKGNRVKDNEIPWDKIYDILDIPSPRNLSNSSNVSEIFVISSFSSFNSVKSCD